MRLERNKKDQNSRELEAEKEFAEITPLLQAAYLVGSGAYADEGTSDEILEAAYRILEDEVARREKYEGTTTLIERINTLTRHSERSTDMYQRLFEQDINSEAISEARDQMKTFGFSLNPLSAMDLIIAEQEVRSGEYDIKSLAHLQPKIPLPGGNPLDNVELTEEDFKRLLSNDKL